jgi:hypothetical protein
MALKQIFAPHLGRKVKMGRRHPVAFGPRFFLRKYLKLPKLSVNPPATCDYSKPALSVLSNIYENDQLGDCVIAGGYHVVGVATGNASNLFTATDQQITADYTAIGGYVPGKPNTDNGCDEVTALNYWCQNGFADGTKGLGWLVVDPSNQQEVAAALYLFENLFLTMDLPDEWVSPMPSGSGFTWDVAGAPDPENGHAVAGVGYGPNGVTIDTWGLLGTLTWNAISRYCASSNGGGLYVMLTPDQLKKGQTKAGNGVDWSALVTDFNSMGGNVPVPKPQPPKPEPIAPQPQPASQRRVFAPTVAPSQKKRVFAPAPRRAPGGAIGRGDFPNALLQGSTAHFKVYYDSSLGAAGPTIANGVLASCEGDHNTIAGYFGGITPPGLPFNVIIASLPGGGAYHKGCNGVDIYCDVKTTPSVDPTFTEFLNVAEVVEVFEAAQGKGWRCDWSNGEGLSRVLATVLYPAELGEFATAPTWLDQGRPDFVNSTDSTDTNPISNGCSVLFLNYLRFQLGKSWSTIAQGAGSTLAKTYANVTGDGKDPFPAFKALLDSKFPPGTSSGLTTDNPWPIKLSPPVITSSKASTATAGKPFSYKITATNRPTSFGVTGLPGGLGLNSTNGVISGTPNGAGSFSVAMSAKNAGGTGTASLALTVKPKPAPQPPGPGPKPPHTGQPPGSGQPPAPKPPVTGGTGGAQAAWVPPPNYPVPPVPPPPPPLAEAAQRAVSTLLRSPALGIVAVVGLVTVGVVGVVALSDGGTKILGDQ